MRFRKKPVVIEAMRLNNHTDMGKIIDWAHEGLHPAQDSLIVVGERCLKIKTLEGEMTAIFGDWIIKGVNREFYPCRPDIFEKTYDRV